MTDIALQESRAASMAGKYLTFRLGPEIYGIEILCVQEIIGLLPITRIPKVSEYIRGVINLRGKVIPVMSLSRRFGVPRILQGRSAGVRQRTEGSRLLR